MDIQTKVLIDSLRQAPLLVGDLAEAPALNRGLLGMPRKDVRLNFHQKLGHLYEDALACLIDGSDRLEQLASHLQVVNGDGRTLGEMDFVLWDTVAQQHLQLELAVKFYLAVETPKGWIYPGPDPRDDWPHKLARMRRHQLKLSQMPETRGLLRARFQIETLEVRQLIYGRLFSPFAGEVCPRPEAIAVDAQCGRWLEVREWG